MKLACNRALAIECGNDFVRGRLEWVIAFTHRRFFSTPGWNQQSVRQPEQAGNFYFLSVRIHADQTAQQGAIGWILIRMTWQLPAAALRLDWQDPAAEAVCVQPF
jgi:hypothetical protein